VTGVKGKKTKPLPGAERGEGLLLDHDPHRSSKLLFTPVTPVTVLEIIEENGDP
jgi:hypothetical protein